MSDVDFSTIEHLDFDVTEEPEDGCEGCSFSDGKGNVTEDYKSCSHAPKVVTVRSCCGVIAKYCMSCYNRICSFHAAEQSSGGTGTHSLKDGSSTHPVRGVPFSQIEFL